MVSLSSLSWALLVWSATTDAQSSSCSVCEETHFFLARGNNEPYPGRQGALVEATCDGLSSCGYEDLYFSSLYTDLYCQTAYDGSVAGHVQMTAYAEQCPHSKLILAGYSQGGQIAGDILGGGGGYSFNGCSQPDTPAMDSTTSPGNQIAAVIIFGDTRHTANQSYNFGNGSALDGWFPRTSTQLTNLEPYSDIMRNWCVSSDPICSANQTLSSYNEESHLGYYDVDSQSAASWIKSVASLTETAAFSTAIPTSLSGIVQNYATLGIATPSGTVRVDTTWTDFSSYAACTATSYTQASSTANSTRVSMPSTTSTSSPASGSVTGSVASVYPLTGSSPQGAAASGTASTTATTSSTSAGNIVKGRLRAVILGFATLVIYYAMY